MKLKRKVTKWSITGAIILSVPLFSLINGVQAMNNNVKPCIASGDSHVVALKDDGTVWSWGNNSNGELGLGDRNDRLIPTEIVGLKDVIQISIGDYHTLVLKRDGTVWSWGDNTEGQLGVGDSSMKLVPTRVNGLDNVKQIIAGGNHSLALKEDGSLWVWGANDKGQLGFGDLLKKTTPTKISDINNIKEVSAGGWHTTVLKEDGSLWSAGWNGDGQLGLGEDVTEVSVFTQIPNIDNVSKIVSGIAYNFAIKNDGSVLGWGVNSHGHLGLGDSGSTKKVFVPTKTALSNVKYISPRLYHTLLLEENGNLLSWGANWEGQLGYNDYTGRKNPTILMNKNDIYQLSTGYYHSIIVQNDGSILIWGYNSNGQLGQGDTEERLVPTLIPNFKLFKTEAEKIVEKAETSMELIDIETARALINELPESLEKDQLQDRLNDIIPKLSMELKNYTSNLDVYVKSENMLSISLDTNSITFEDFSGVEDIEKLGAINISVNSSLPYSLNAYLPSEIQNSDKTKTMNKSILNIKESSDSNYKTFSNVNEKLILKDGNLPGNNILHSIDLKLKGRIAHEADVYRATLKFEIEQK